MEEEEETDEEEEAEEASTKLWIQCTMIDYDDVIMCNDMLMVGESLTSQVHDNQTG